MKFLVDYQLCNFTTDQCISPYFALAQILGECLIKTGQNCKAVGNIMIGNNGNVYLITPNYSLKITEDRLKKIQETYLTDSNITLSEIPDVFS